MPETETDYAPTWPGVIGSEQQPGMKITGEVVDIREFENKRGDRRVSVDLRTEDGTVYSVPGWHYGLTQLYDELGEAGKLDFGVTLTVEYKGEKPLDGGRNPMKLYEVNGRGNSGGGRRPSWLGGSSAPPIEAPSLAETVAKSKVASAPAEADDDDSLPF